MSLHNGRKCRGAPYGHPMKCADGRFGVFGFWFFFAAAQKRRAASAHRGVYSLSLRRARDLTEGSSEDKSQRQNTHRMVALGNAHALLRGEGHPSPRGGAVGRLSDDGRRRAAADALRRQLPHLPLLPRTFHLGREPESLRHLFLYRARTGHTPHAAFRPARRFMSIAGPARLLNPPGALPY